MNLKNKKILVIGMGISGISTIKYLHEKKAANILVYDKKNKEDLSHILYDLRRLPIEYYLDGSMPELKPIDLIIKSPGVPPNIDLILKAREEGIEIISDIELAYREFPCKKIIAITGSNGKTTTTHIIGELLKRAGISHHMVGNIGIGILDKLKEMKDEDLIIIEASSFQLEDSYLFKPWISLLLNISPDHLDWHGSYENYINSKKKIFRNQDKNDFIILNYDDIRVREFAKEIKSQIIFFSQKVKLDKGIYLDGNEIIINLDRKISLMDSGDLKIIGKHNLENALSSIGVFHAIGLDEKIVKEGLSEFKGIEHRLEFVAEKSGRKFYNDSKGTNPEASIKAIEAIEAPIHLIAGGYDKNSSFDNFIKAFNNKVKSLILLGETKEKLKEAAIKQGFSNYYLVENMFQAVNLAYRLSEAGDNILLSPACASWGLYKDFQERGQDFKEKVFNLGEGKNES